jgi:hypothetical protein
MWFKIQIMTLPKSWQTYEKERPLPDFHAGEGGL